MTSEGQPLSSVPPGEGEAAAAGVVQRHRVRTPGKAQPGGLPGQRGLASRGCLRSGEQWLSHITSLDLSFSIHKTGNGPLHHGTLRGGEQTARRLEYTPKPSTTGHAQSSPLTR